MTNIYDFGSQLSAIGDTIQQNRETNRQRELLDKIGSMKDASGKLDYGLAAETALRLGDIKTAQVLSSIHNQQLERALAERKFAVEPYAPHPTIPGAVVARQGGSADPNAVADLSAAKEKPPHLTVTDIDKLGKTTQQFQNLTGFAQTFKPEYAGYTVPGLGGASMWLGRNAPEGYAPGSTREASTWWQSYDRFKNVVRNELYGSALTPSEQAAFEKADINPNMNADQIKANLDMQHQIAKKGIKLRAEALLAEGYRPESVERVFGTPLAELGIAVQPRRQFGTQQQPQATPQQPPPQTQQPPPVDPRSLPPPLSGATPPQPTTAAPAPGSFQDRYSGVSAPREPAPAPQVPTAPGAAPRTPRPEAVAALKANPGRAAEFDAYYGQPGLASRILGQR